MNDFVNMLKPYVASTARHLMTVAAGGLAAHGVIANTDQSEFIQLGTAVALGLAAQGWAWYQKTHQAKALAAAIAAPAGSAGEIK